MNEITGAPSSCPRVDDAGEGRTGGLKAAAPLPSDVAAPGFFRLHLPLPPSVNRFKKSRTTGKPLGNRTDKVAAWRRECNVCVAQITPALRPRPGQVPADFALEVVWESRRYRKWDIDNRLKALLDWLQAVELVTNDRLCWKLTVGWGSAPRGCVVTVTPVILLEGI